MRTRTGTLDAIGALILILALLPGVAFVTACDRKRELSVKDTEGRSYDVSCAADGECQIVAGTGATSSESIPRLTRTGRVLGICEGENGAAYDCRALRCETTADCPPERASTVACSRGFCVDSTRPYIREDIVMLCLAGTGVGHDLPVQRERYVRALESGEPPRVPAGCASP